MKTNKPMMPLREVHDLGEWAKADPDNKQDYVCGLVAATTDAVLAAMKNGRPGGWIFVQENFIRAVRAIRDMNNARGTAYTDRDLEERLPAAWSRMADAIETCARVVPRPCAGARRIPRDVLGCPVETPAFGWSRPIRGDALQGLFDYCLETAKAALTSPTDRATVEDWYKSGVFDDREENRRTLSLHTNMLREAAQTDARLEGKVDSMAAKLDAIAADVKRGANAAEGARTAAEKAAKKPTTVINAQPGATVNVVKPSRTDAGGTHGKTARGWRTQEDMATDFSKSATKICGKWYGEVSVAVAKDWEARYPNEARRERKSGYHAGLRNEPNPTPETKKAYYEAAANWNDYWRKHNEAFNAWLKANPNGDHATFLKTWERPGKTVHRNDTDKTMRYGADTSLPDVLDSGDFDNET